MAEPVLWSSLFDRKRSLDELIKESHADNDFYLFLSVSAIITTLGLISDNGVVVIGGMLVAPILYPILFLSMAVVTSSKEAVHRGLRIILKSILVALIISLVISFLFQSGVANQEILLRAKADLISFLIAFFAGIAAAFGWVKKKGVSAEVAGIAVSVSLIPPLSALAIGVTTLNMEIVSGTILLFLLNLLGIVVAGMIVFSLFGFSNMQKEEEEKIEEEEVEEVIQKKALQEAHAEERVKKIVENAAPTTQ